MIVDVHTHTPTHEHAVPEEDKLSYGSWNNGPPVITTQSWSEWAEGTAAADVTIVFNIAVEDPGADASLPGDPSRNRTSRRVPTEPRQASSRYMIDRPTTRADARWSQQQPRTLQ